MLWFEQFASGGWNLADSCVVLDFAINRVVKNTDTVPSDDIRAIAFITNHKLRVVITFGESRCRNFFLCFLFRFAGFLRPIYQQRTPDTKKLNLPSGSNSDKTSSSSSSSSSASFISTSSFALKTYLCSSAYGAMLDTKASMNYLSHLCLSPFFLMQEFP